jgi:hypothetical protein
VEALLSDTAQTTGENARDKNTHNFPWGRIMYLIFAAATIFLAKKTYFYKVLGLKHD